MKFNRLSKPESYLISILCLKETAIVSLLIFESSPELSAVALLPLESNFNIFRYDYLKLIGEWHLEQRGNGSFVALFWAIGKY